MTERVIDPVLLTESLEELYEQAPCGDVSMLADATVTKVNQTACNWIGRSADSIVGKPFHDLLTVGGRMYYETHVGPLLAMQGHARQLSLDLVRADAPPMPILIDLVRRVVSTAQGSAELTRVTIADATQRRTYERELLAATRRAEEALAQVRTLRGLLPICAWCRRVRNDTGMWEQLDLYIRQHTDTEFTHGICKDCSPAHFSPDGKS